MDAILDFIIKAMSKNSPRSTTMSGMLIKYTLNIKILMYVLYGKNIYTILFKFSFVAAILENSILGAENKKLRLTSTLFFL